MMIHITRAYARALLDTRSLKQLVEGVHCAKGTFNKKLLLL